MRHSGDRLRRYEPCAERQRRTLREGPTPEAVPTAPRLWPRHDDAQKAVMALRNELATEPENADLVLMGAPMYNVSIPSTLKARTSPRRSWRRPSPP
ncbi:NAD(P)H-dependent oxidoreductase [Streptomyces sp. TLI_105]|uniref:NAD(P)H-dependent oxidoreductase n=1 Tax=Streptomyces sp. TLI_105 TaxID=1881019 RepID=UPI000D19CB55|nr:NAD(P)H-dependent oxidoreductase [Streptomyces sp. TLI_105]